jgi:alkanesulfonate monooxygenase
MSDKVRSSAIKSVLWFLPTSGDNRYVGSAIGARTPTFDYLQSVAKAADILGFDSMLVPSGRWCDDAWVLASALAPLTNRVGFLMAVRPGMYSPVVAARMVSAMDRLSLGRMQIMVVPGGDNRELAADGLFLPHDERYAMTDEWLTVLRRVLTEPEVTFSGKYVRVEGASVPYPCVQRPHPPIYLGVSSPAGLALAAKHADVFLSWGELPEQVEEKISIVKRLANDYGREPRFGLRTHVIVRETETQAWTDAEELIRYVDETAIARYQSYFNSLDSHGQKRMLALHNGSRDNLRIAPNLWAGVGLVRGGCGTALVGNAHNILNQLEPYEALGIDMLILSGYPHLEEAYRVAEMLFPRWQRSSPTLSADKVISPFFDPTSSADSGGASTP